MRWFVGSVLSLVLAWALYLVSPYWTLYELATAVERGDVEQVADRINLRALRVSLARQIASDMAAADTTGALGLSEAQIAAGAAIVLADPALDPVMTPAGILDLLRRREPGTRPDLPASPFADGLPSLEHAWQYLAASNWRGFRNVYFALPPGRARNERYRIQLRLSRLSWRVVSLELPHTLRRTIATKVMQR